jgi:hypothetical protein
LLVSYRGHCRRISVEESFPARNRNSNARDSEAKILSCPELDWAETETRARNAAYSGLFSGRREISGSARMRGGPGRCAHLQQFQRLGLSNRPKSDF